MEGRILFTESQPFSRSPTWIILVITAFISAGVIGGLGLAGALRWGEAVFPLLILGVTYAVMFVGIRITRLETTVTTQGIYYRWYPFMRRLQFIPRSSVQKLTERKSPWMQYGYKWVPGYGKVHHVSGRSGMQLELEGGRRIFLGTAEPFLMRKAIEQIMAKEKI